MRLYNTDDGDTYAMMTLCQQEKVNYEVIFRNIYLSNISVKKDLELS